MNECICDLEFHPAREVCDKNNKKLFGFIARKQNRKLVMIIDIYEESRKEEIIEKIKMMAALAEVVVKKEGIDRVCVVGTKDVSEQLAKYHVDPLKSNKDNEQDITIEAEDWVRGGFVSIDFTMGILRDEDT